MAFAIRHKHTGELWKGKNLRDHKVYATRGNARNAISSIINTNGYYFRQMISIPLEEFLELAREGVTPTKKEVEDLKERWRRARYDFPNDRELDKELFNSYQQACWERDRKTKENEKRLQQEYCMWEVVEV